MKHEARVSDHEMAYQSAPNCKQKAKRKQKKKRKQKSHKHVLFLLLFNSRTVCDNNVGPFFSQQKLVYFI